MLAEKLLLHVLIILAPVLIYSMIFENRKLGKSPYIIGILYGISGALCLLCTYTGYGLYWDLRYIPLILSIIYGGPLAGGITFFSIFITRVYVGGDTLLIGFASVLGTAIVPFICAKFFMKLPKRRRMWSAILMGFWPEVIQLCILFSHQLFLQDEVVTRKLISFIFIFGLIQILGIGIASWLHEAIIERGLVKKEIERAEKLNTLGDLAASIAHEVRNPLTVVKGFLQLIQKEEKGNNYEYLSIVLNELGRAESIISDYLNFAKPKAFQKPENIRMDQVVSEVVFLLESMAIKNGVVLEHNIEEAVEYQADKNQLKQALVNLIKNSIEATPNGGKVWVSLTQEGGQIKIVIKDNGKGMTEAQLSRIGTLFYTTKDKGTGLGTTVSLNIIESMNGKVKYSSQLNAGTKISITFRNHV
ncbi:ATP-binding protein [Bacillus sp. FJAT-49736]|uniref:ATP-binding protein n=1 Tax=Bacillus sp. FJAT-49736 TaxID=2833582 RepID=UPI001BC9537B|nr:ATP-binding protein [Bacillus sp. FJAT-49736]MBS4174218.1 ATP-binding protein [Bacillus sp. FJAT-49736]